MVGIATMATDLNMTDFVEQMKAFQASDEARQRFFDSVFQKYSSLLDEHGLLKNDLANEIDGRRNSQERALQKERELEASKRDLDNASFVLALIDGDGVIFQDALLQAATGDGGSEAASRLQVAVRNHVASLYTNSGNWPIMVQIYVSLDKLAQKLASVGMLRNPQELRTFAQCFSVNQSLFSIIDVGYGKERADHKIKEMLRTFSDNPTCRHIVFGGCHDAGYLLNLDQYKHNAGKAARITLLESTPAHRGFADLPNFQRARFDDVFKNEALPDYGYTAYMQPPIQSPVSAPAKPLTRTLTGGSSTPSHTHATPSTTSPSTTMHTPDADASWATVGQTGASPNGTISIAPKTNPKKKWAYFNKEDQRLDETLPPRDQPALYTLEQRMKRSGKNLCNHWHLNNERCHNGAKCGFQHEPKLNPKELNVLRHKTRSLPCKNRYCENIYCYLGHQCAFERESGYCSYTDTCNLKHTHGMDKKPVLRWDEQGNEETLK